MKEEKTLAKFAVTHCPLAVDQWLTGNVQLGKIIYVRTELLMVWNE